MYEEQSREEAKVSRPKITVTESEPDSPPARQNAVVQGNRLGKFMRKQFISDYQKELEEQYHYKKRNLFYNLVYGYRFAPAHVLDYIGGKKILNKERKQEKRHLGLVGLGMNQMDNDMDDEMGDLPEDIRENIMATHNLEAKLARERLAEMNMPKGLSWLDRKLLPRKQAPTSLSKGPEDPRIANERIAESFRAAPQQEFIPPPQPMFASFGWETPPSPQRAEESAMPGPHTASYDSNPYNIDVGEEISGSGGSGMTAEALDRLENRHAVPEPQPQAGRQRAETVFEPMESFAMPQKKKWWQFGK